MSARVVHRALQHGSCCLPMNSPAGPLAVVELALPVFLVIGTGFILRRAGVLTLEADKSLLAMILKVFLPCLAFDAIMGNATLTHPRTALLPPLAGFLLAASGFALGAVVAAIFLHGKTVRGTFVLAAGVPNYAYIPLSFCSVLFDREAVGVLFALGLGVELAMWTIGVGLLRDSQHPRFSLRLVVNPPLLAVVAALCLNLAGADRLVPASVDSAWHMLGICAVPLGLLLTGATLADHLKVEVLKTGWGTVCLALAVRLGAMPAIILTAALYLPLDTPLRQVLLVQAAMPSAVIPVILARLYKGDMPTVLRVVVATSFASFVTMPLWLSYGLQRLASVLANGGH